MNRRGLLGFASAGVALTVLRPPTSGALSGWWPMTVIYDERYSDARAFADFFRVHGAAPLPTRGDGTDLWYGGSGTALRQTGGPVAGLTAYSDLIVARSCGRELGLRLVFERPYVRDIDQTGYPDRVAGRELGACREIINSIAMAHRPRRVMVREGGPSMTCGAGLAKIVGARPSPGMTVLNDRAIPGAVISRQTLTQAGPVGLFAAALSQPTSAVPRGRGAIAPSSPDTLDRPDRLVAWLLMPRTSG